MSLGIGHLFFIQITCIFVATDMASALKRRFWDTCLKLTGADRHFVRNGYVLNVFV